MARRLNPSRARTKAVRRLRTRRFRSRDGAFLAEGLQVVREALKRPGTVTEVFATDEKARSHRDVRALAAESEIVWYTVDGETISSLSQTVSPQTVIAVCRFIDVTLEQALAPTPPVVVVCADLRDPGNAGTVIRSADAAGAGAVILAGSSVDPYNAKCVRASAGSLFHLPICPGVAVATALSALRDRGYQTLAADARGGIDLDQLIDSGRLSKPTAWIFGNEAWGLPDALKSMADAVVRVPIYGRAESLNVASAAAVCLYASARAMRTG
jgi:RNA methyltransferase, TrmH family